MDSSWWLAIGSGQTAETRASIIRRWLVRPVDRQMPLNTTLFIEIIMKNSIRCVGEWLLAAKSEIKLKFSERTSELSNWISRNSNVSHASFTTSLSNNRGGNECFNYPARKYRLAEKKKRKMEKLWRVLKRGVGAFYPTITRNHRQGSFAKAIDSEFSIRRRSVGANDARQT